MKFLKYIAFVALVIGGVFLFKTYWEHKNEAPILYGNVQENIEFKKDLFLDLYEPTNLVFDKNPVVLYIHGGGFITGRKESVNFNRINHTINALRNAGYAVITTQYTTAETKTPPFPDCIYDCYDASKWILDNKAEYNFDVNNIGVVGESAGGNLALMLGFADKKSFRYKHNLPKINYVVDIYAPNDLTKMFDFYSDSSVTSKLSCIPKLILQNLEIPERILGHKPEENMAETQFLALKYSPYYYVHKNGPPTLIVHGNRDEIVPISQSIRLKRKLDSLKVENKMYILQNMNHAFFNANEVEKLEVENQIVNFITSKYNKNGK